VNVQHVLDRLQGVHPSGKQWKAPCPAHADKNPSLAIAAGDKKVLLKCFAGCTEESICSALGINPADLFYVPNGAWHKAVPRIVATYDYANENGVTLYRKIRYEPKRFSFQRPDGKGGWIGNLESVDRVLYQLPKVLANDNVLVVEGEKDAETALKLGACATTGGSTTDAWLPQFTDVLRGKNVVVIADADAPGRDKARKIAAALYGAATSVRLGEMPQGKDRMV